MAPRVLLATILFCAAQASAQPEAVYQIRHISRHQGLFSTVHSIAQDGDGYIWIGTAHTLQRYDGVRFKDYTPYLKGVPYLSYIDNIHFDLEKNIWLNCPQLVRLNTQTGRVTVFDNDSLRKSPEFQFALYKGENGSSWLVSDWGLFFKDTSNKEFKQIFYSFPGAPSKWVNGLCYDPVENGYWFSAGSMMCFLDKANQRFFSQTHNSWRHPLLQLPPLKNIATILATPAREIWLGTYGGGILQYDRATKRLTEYNLQGILQSSGTGVKNNRVGMISCFLQDSRGTIWAGSDDGKLWRYNRPTASFTPITNSWQKPNTAGGSYSIQCITEDRKGQLWIGTDKGIDVFHPYRQPFSSLSHDEDNPQSLPRFEITSVFQSRRGDVYVSTWGGGFSVFDSSLRFRKTVSPGGVYEYPLTWSFAEVSDTIWVSAQHGVIHLFTTTGKVKSIQPVETEGSTIMHMLTDSTGNIWLALHNGKIVKWEKKTKRFVGMHSKVGVANNISVVHLFLDRKGTLWTGTNAGLLQYDTARKIYTGFYTPAPGGAAQVNPGIRGIEQLNDSILLVATVRQGLCLFNIRKKKFDHPPVSSLTNTRLYAVKKDKEGNVWLTADYELLYWVVNENRVERFNPGDDLLRTAFESPRFAVLKDGRWATTSTTEVVVFNPALLTETKKDVPKPLVVGLRVFGDELPMDSIRALNGPAEFSAGQNYLVFQLTDLSFSETGAGQFVYRLGGMHDHWRLTDEKGEVSYTNLPPGRYSLQVKSNNANAVPATIFHFRIRPPFYATWWFVALAVATAAFLIFALFRQRVKVIRHEAELKHRIAEAEMDALRAQMNPHFIFNCLNAIDNMIQTNQKEKATTYLGRFARLIRSVLESSKTPLVPLHKDVETTKLYLDLERFRSSNKFVYELKIDPDLLNGGYRIPSLVVQPFLENAIHHGLMNKVEDDRRLSVAISLRQEYIKYTIVDNGVGREVANRLNELNRSGHHSYGMQISKDRIGRHNGNKNGEAVVVTDLEEAGKPAGTQVEVYIKPE